jgi:hypothetical protein
MAANVSRGTPGDSVFEVWIELHGKVNIGAVQKKGVLNTRATSV